VEWPKEISKFFSRQRLASISQVGFRVINISSLGVFYKNRGFTWRVSDCEELLGVSHRGMMGLVLDRADFQGLP
jgi:hypothetical protein